MNYQLPYLTRINKFLIITFVSLFLLNSIAKLNGINFTGFLGLSYAALLKGHFWSLLTYVFLPGGLIEIIFDALIFWFLGSELEGLWGEKRYGQFLTTSAIGGGLFFLLISALFFGQSMLASFPLHGPTGLASSMCVVYGLLFPDRMMYFFMFPVKAKWFVAILIGMNLYHGVFSPGGIFAWSQIGAIVCGMLWMIFVGNSSLRNKLKNLFNRQSSSRNKKSNRKKITHLHIVESSDDDNDRPTYH